MSKLKQLREGVKALTSAGNLSVRAVRDAFTQGVAPLQTASSGSAADFISRFGDGQLPELVRSTAQLGLRTAKVGKLNTPPRPEIDFIQLDDDPTYGIVDSFYARIVVSLPLKDAAGFRCVRLLRCNNGKIGAKPPSFSALIDGMPTTQPRTNTDPIGIAIRRGAQLGVGNQATTMLNDDEFTQRSVVSSKPFRSLPPTQNTNRRSSPAALVSVDGMDRSVLENVTFFINRRASEVPKAIELPLTVGKRSDVNILRGSSISKGGNVPAKGNSERFRELLRVPISPSTTRQRGAFVEISLYDPSIVYGASYTYYAVCSDVQGNDSPRSRLVTLNVDRQIPPPSPTVLYSIVAGRPRFSISVNDGRFLDHIEVFRKGGVVPKNARLISTDGALVSESDPLAVGAFFHIGDLGLGIDRSATFTDAGALPGHTLDYRIYTVDAFGMKSQVPFECRIVMPDHGRHAPVSPPAITAEQGVGGRRINVTVRCDDLSISQFLVRRREVGNSERAFHEPGDPAYFRFGSTDAKRSRSRSGPSVIGSKVWSGVLTPVSGVASFVDTVVGFDRTYQYIAECIDIRGNRSSAAISHMVRVSARPVAESPVALTADIILSDGAPSGVRVSWSPGTDDFSPNDLIGDQDVLYATSVRSLYQVERRLVGGTIWEAMPATTGTEFIDPVAAADSPLFRPTYALPTLSYDYRVIAMQSGGFISNHTDPVRVTISPELGSVGTLWARSTDTAIRPCHVAVSWNYSGDFVDGWEVERASVNKLYASKITSVDSQRARELEYEPLGTVRRESSRAQGLSATEMPVDQTIFVGNRYYLDTDISLDNSYFYRIRPVDSIKKGEWTYAGISLVDSPHDRKLLSILSDDEKVELGSDARSFTRK